MNLNDQNLEFEQTNFPLEQKRQTLNIKTIAKISFFIILASCLLFLVGFYGYTQGQKNSLQPIESSITTTPTPTEEVCQLNIPTPMESIYNENPRINLCGLEDLKSGYPSSNENPEFEVFLFADFTEDTHSARMLTENADHLLKQYPQTRVWYLHTVLPYRDNSNLNSAIAVLKCLSDQGSVWQNMNNMIKEKGRPDFIYQVDNQEKYISCITEINKNSEYFESNIKKGQDLMQKYGVTGIPTTLFVSTKDPSYGIKIVGATPKEEFKKKVKEIIGE
jgi:protein-disulfide isomerase